METILEQQRRYHEERERLVQLMVDEYVDKKTTVSSSHHGHFSRIPIGINSIYCINIGKVC